MSLQKKPKKKIQPVAAKDDSAKDIQGSKYVRDNAILKCSCGSSLGKLKVNSQEFVWLQNDLKATSSDKKILPSFFGTCSAKNGNACTPVLMEWQKTAEDVQILDSSFFLLEVSTNQCSSGGGKITIESGLQKSTVKSIGLPIGDLPLITPLTVENKEVVWFVSNENYNSLGTPDKWYEADENKKVFRDKILTDAIKQKLIIDPSNNTIAIFTNEKKIITKYKKGITIVPDYGNKNSTFESKLNSPNPLYLRGGKYMNAYPTYKMYVYKGHKEGDAKAKLTNDLNNFSHSQAALLIEIARHTRENNIDYFSTAGPIPPTGVRNQPEYYFLNYVISSTPRFRVVIDKTDVNSLIIVKDPNRAGVSIDPFVSADLEGCIGIRDGKGGYFQTLEGGKTHYFTLLNDKLINLIPELLNIYRKGVGTGKLAKKKFDEKKETIFYVKADPLPDVQMAEFYTPWEKKIKELKSLQGKGAEKSIYNTPVKSKSIIASFWDIFK